MNAYQKLLQTGINQKSVPRLNVSNFKTIHWNECFYNLSNSKLFNSLHPAQKESILVQLNQSTIHELTQIEKAGTKVAQSIAEKSTCTEEQMLYAMISGEEVNHYYALASYLPEDVLKRPENEFVQIIEKVIKLKERAQFNFVVQIILEGFGVHYFNSLRQHCLSEDLKKTLEMIIQDEARHHGAGIVSFKSSGDSSLNSANLRPVFNSIKDVLMLFRVGPLTVLNTIEQTIGELSDRTRLELLSDIQAVKSAQDYLNIFKKLIQQAEAIEMLKELDAEGCFSPFGIEQMNSIYVDMKTA